MRKYEDTYLHKGLRKQLIDILRNERKITDETVLYAMSNVPRHFFLDSAFDRIAYEDRAFPIGEGQTISQPYTVAYQSQLLQIKKTDTVLEIGTGSIYQASVLAEMGADVFTIERQKKLFEAQKDFPLKSKYPNIHFFYGDGYQGLQDYAPFDKILITAAAPYIPEKLMAQLKVGGKMVIPLQNIDEIQTMMRITKNDDGTWEEEVFDNFSFVPMLGGESK
ncbi:protein-L-isoaspartate(D-aspartate) O-methyltransferase [Arachidicoccus sp.]|uniref:protein-L-isoaspartate(D-aspartate) O-methyltransferase n=1 Tax=Arachidicoccus sp. TaxID=1872624 RepID=UPI003D257166